MQKAQYDDQITLDNHHVQNHRVSDMLTLTTTADDQRRIEKYRRRTRRLLQAGQAAVANVARSTVAEISNETSTSKMHRTQDAVPLQRSNSAGCAKKRNCRDEAKQLCAQQADVGHPDAAGCDPH